jgi:hypothetical protein
MKLPPKEKILEAYTAVADGRITMHDGKAECLSSDHAKIYQIEWEGKTYASSDSATYWQCYPGYPVLAVLMLSGKLPYDVSLVQEMKGIPWKKLNDKYKRDYTKAAEEAMRNLPHRKDILQMAQNNNESVSEMDLVLKRKIKH